MTADYFPAYEESKKIRDSRRRSGVRQARLPGLWPACLQIRVQEGLPGQFQGLGLMSLKGSGVRGRRSLLAGSTF
jgi:hypothetical protein